MSSCSLVAVDVFLSMSTKGRGPPNGVFIAAGSVSGSSRDLGLGFFRNATFPETVPFVHLLQLLPRSAGAPPLEILGALLRQPFRHQLHDLTGATVPPCEVLKGLLSAGCVLCLVQVSVQGNVLGTHVFRFCLVCWVALRQAVVKIMAVDVRSKLSQTPCSVSTMCGQLNLGRDLHVL